MYTLGGDIHMSRSRNLQATVAYIFAVLLILSPFSALLLDSHRAVAQIVDCARSSQTGEVAYDDGEPYGQMWTHSAGGCDQCQTFQGVLFSLPEGVSSSVLS